MIWLKNRRLYRLTENLGTRLNNTIVVKFADDLVVICPNFKCAEFVLENWQAKVNFPV